MRHRTSSGQEMHPITFLLVAIVACVVSLDVQAQSVAPAHIWQTYQPKNAHFRINMPGKPDVAAEDLPDVPGTMMHSVSINFGKGGFAVFYYEIARYRLTKSVNEYLDHLRNITVEAMQGIILSEQQEFVKDLPTRRMTIDPANGLIVTMRFVLHKSRVYQIVALGPPGFSESPDAKWFLDSFYLIGQ